MKKLTVLLFVFACCLSSCDSSKKKVRDSLEGYKLVYHSITALKDVALDPFNVAYRFHLYRAGGATEALRSELLPYATIFEGEDGQSDTLRFTEPVHQPFNDYIRAGEVVIHTYGTSLSDENAVWQVTATVDNSGLGYYVYSPVNGYWYLTMDKNEFTISNQGANRFRVQADAIYMAGMNSGSAWNWDLDLIVTRAQGSGSSLNNSRFEIEAGSVPAASGFVNSTDGARYRYEILEPVLYTTDCSYLNKSGGKEQVIRMEMKGYKGLDSMVLDFGQNYTSCDPGFTLSVRAEDDEKWTTQNYAPGGIWIQ